MLLVLQNKKNKKTFLHLNKHLLRIRDFAHWRPGGPFSTAEICGPFAVEEAACGCKSLGSPRSVPE
jgi:hypothetical protein